MTATIDLDADTDPYARPASSAPTDATAQRAKAARMDAAFGKLGKPEKKLLLEQLCVVDPVAWAKARAGFVLDPWQKAFLRAKGNTAVVAGRRVGKTAVVAIKAAHHIAVAEEVGVPDRTALVIAPSLRQATETTRAARAALARAMPGVEFSSDNKLMIELPWGARMIALPGESNTSRGFTASLAIAEESQSLEHAEEILATIAPTLATTQGDLVLVGTPLDLNDPLHRIFEGEAADDPSWTRFRIPTRWCPRVPRSFLEEQRRLLGEVLYQREFEALWTAPENSMFDPDLLQGAMLPDNFQFDRREGFAVSRRSPLAGKIASPSSPPSPLDAALAAALLPR